MSDCWRPITSFKQSLIELYRTPLVAASDTSWLVFSLLLCIFKLILGRSSYPTDFIIWSCSWKEKERNNSWKSVQSYLIFQVILSGIVLVEFILQKYQRKLKSDLLPAWNIIGTVDAVDQSFKHPKSSFSTEEAVP